MKKSALLGRQPLNKVLFPAWLQINMLIFHTEHYTDI